MQQLFDLFIKTGLRPLAYYKETEQLEKQYTHSDLTTVLILSFRGEQPMSLLAQELGAPLSSMTSIAKRLERKGIIARKTSPQDQRVTLVTLTKAGERLAEQSKQIIQRLLLRIEEALTPEELEQFIQLSVKIGRVLQEPASNLQAEQPTLKRIRIED